jgi:hypothetical protein
VRYSDKVDKRRHYPAPIRGSEWIDSMGVQVEMGDRLYHLFYIGLRRGFGHAERASFLFATFQGYLVLSFFLWASRFFPKSLVASSPLIFAMIPTVLIVDRHQLKVLCENWKVQKNLR